MENPAFSHFHHIEVAAEEEYSANCIWVNGKVLVPAGFLQTQKAIESLGYEVLTVDTSEYRKIDGGLELSLSAVLMPSGQWSIKKSLPLKA